MANKVLIIDDEPAILSLVKYTLEAGGFEVHTCDSGRRAWDEIARLKPDLLLLDVMLPGVDGYSLMTQISEDGATKAMPVILLTALESARALFQKFPQVVGFMTKPFKPTDLLMTVQDAFSKRAA
jgi:DNA-binding response OmpR family regulator